MVPMDITALSKNSIKIRGKSASFVVDPERGIQKTNADGIIRLKKNSLDISRITDYRVILDGPGEYEVGGVKISALTIDSGFVYNMIIDGMWVILGDASGVSKIKDTTLPCQAVILNVDTAFNSSFLTSLEPRLVVLYGDKKTDGAKMLGKVGVIQQSLKCSISKDKLPEEMEIVVLRYGKS